METFILVTGFQKKKKKKIFSLFAIVKMNANYAEICRQPRNPEGGEATVIEDSLTFPHSC